MDIQISKGDNSYKIYAYTDNISKKNGFVECKYKKAVVLFVGGAADKESFAGQTATNIMGLVKDNFEKIFEKNNQYLSNHLGYNEIYGEERINKNVISFIPNKEGTEIFIIGHSLGGWNGAHLTHKLVSKGYKVKVLVTLDPVGARRGTAVVDIYYNYPTPKSDFWIDIYTNPDNNEIDDNVADLGGQWTPNKQETTYFIETKLHHGDASGMLDEKLIKEIGLSSRTLLINKINNYLFAQ